MNNKGFTTIELLLTMLLVVIIMATITNVTYTYQDRSNYEEIISETVNYKNNLTKVIYDDILNPADRVVSITKVNDNTFNLITTTNKIYPLQIIENINEVSINYNEVNYIIPGSKDGLVTIEDINYYFDTVNSLYSMDIVFRNRNIEDLYKIHFAIT